MMESLTFIIFSSGEEFETDLVFTCVGNKTRMDLTSAAGLDLNEWGQVRVDRTDLHVIGKNTSKSQVIPFVFSDAVSEPESIVIFISSGKEGAYAIGDCCDYDQEKMAAHAVDHGTLVADNINLSLGGRQVPYEPY